MATIRITAKRAPNHFLRPQGRPSARAALAPPEPSPQARAGASPSGAPPRRSPYTPSVAGKDRGFGDTVTRTDENAHVRPGGGLLFTGDRFGAYIHDHHRHIVLAPVD